jgi:hypothetical protein
MRDSTYRSGTAGNTIEYPFVGKTVFARGITRPPAARPRSFKRGENTNMRYALAIAACTGIMALYCLLTSYSSGHPAEELLYLLGLAVSIDYTWRHIMNAKTLDGPSQRQP